MNNSIDEARVTNMVIEARKFQEDIVEREIERTPTGEKRNALCDLNIALEVFLDTYKIGEKPNGNSDLPEIDFN